MKPEEQRIAIAKAYGWRCLAGHDWIAPGDPFKAKHSQELPDFLNDLNACFVFEDGLTVKQVPIYRTWLKKIADFATATFGPDWELIHATAAQRSEAFLRTIGKWIDDPEPAGI